MPSHYWIGIDGGGTKTTGILLDEQQQLVAEVRGESTNFNSIGQAAARLHLHQIIENLLAHESVSVSQVAGIGLGISGVSTPADKNVVASWVADALPGTPCEVDNDAIMALAAANGGDLFGIVVVSGTGMIVIGVNRSGQRRRVGGWGPLLGDQGSGFAIGSAALKAIADAEDGLGGPTLLTEVILSHLKLNTPRELETWAYAEYKWARFAALAPLVTQCAQQGDAVSCAIMERSAAILGKSIEVVAQQLGMSAEPFPCLFTGGNLAPNNLLSQRLVQYLRDQTPNASIDQRLLNPAIGAAQFAVCQIKR